MPKRRGRHPSYLSAQSCSICYGGVRHKPIELRPCGHQVHRECLDQWPVAKPTCPLCRCQVTNYQPPMLHPFPNDTIDEYTQRCTHCGQYVEWDGSGCRRVTCQCGHSFSFTQRPRRTNLRFYFYLWLAGIFFFLLGSSIADGYAQRKWERFPDKHLVTEAALGELMQEKEQLLHSNAQLHDSLEELHQKIEVLKSQLRLKEAQNHLFNWSYQILRVAPLLGGVLSLFYFNILRF